MASDESMLKAAIKKWQELYAERTFSVAPGMGYIAILCSETNDWLYEPGSPEAIAEIELFAREAKQLKEIARLAGRSTRIFAKADYAAMAEVLGDRDATDVITIGHGSLSTFDVPGTEEDTVDWSDVSDLTDHLKTGNFSQRHCGGVSRTLAVPLGTFALADIRNLFAAVGTSFEPKTIFDEEVRKLKAVFTHPLAGQLTYKGLKEQFKPKPDNEES